VGVQGLSVAGLGKAEVFVVRELTEVLRNYVLKVVEHRGNSLDFVRVDLLLVLLDRFFLTLSGSFGSNEVELLFKLLLELVLHREHRLCELCDRHFFGLDPISIFGELLFQKEGVLDPFVCDDLAHLLKQRVVLFDEGRLV
jgi:hypothetical protein